MTKERIKKMWSAFFSKEKGSALILALIAMLVLTLLGLSLLLQSNTEFVIAINERDSTAALENAEGGLQLAKAVVSANSSGPNLTNLLAGPDGNPLTLTDNGIISIRVPNPALTNEDQLNDNCSGSVPDTCETTRSVIRQVFDGNYYEIFRIGIDRDGNTAPGKSGWDGPRGLVYVRVEDNYDDEPASNNPWTDTDKSIIGHVISQYPIQVNSNGVYTGPSLTANLRVAGVSTRQLTGRFGAVSTKPAIVTEGNMELGGSLHVCGECGSVHANLDLTIDTDDSSFSICKDATESNNTPSVTGPANIGGTVGNADPINVPTANPFSTDYDPDPDWFDTQGDTELTSFPKLQCDYDPTTNPDVSKYFALVADGGNGLVYKAYWDPTTTPPRWKWRLIDDLNDNIDTTLDDCGRVISGISTAVFGQDAHAGEPPTGPVDDSENAQHKIFYGFAFGHGNFSTTCNENNDATLGPTSGENNFVENNYFSGLGLPTNVILPGTYFSGTETDDDYEASLWFDKTQGIWSINASTVYSPLYNSVVFVFGNLSLNGNLNDICDSGGCGTLPNNIWRATFVTVGNIDVSGNPKYAPVRSFERLPDNQYLMVSGRDIKLAGTAGEGDICPLTACSDPPANLAGYAGIILAHEQICSVGNVTINGLLKSEDAAHCANLCTGQGMEITGSVEVYYDCQHPPDNSGQAVRLQSWEENQ